MKPVWTIAGQFGALLAPAWELVTLAALVLFYLAGEEFFPNFSPWVRLVLGPAVLTAVLALGALRMILLEAGAIWTALFWFRVASAVYLGIGSISPLVVAPDLRLYMEQFYHFSDHEIARVGLLVTSSTLAVLLTANLLLLWGGSHARPAAGAGDGSRAMLPIALAFLAVGGPVKYLLQIPANFGLLDYVVPGSVALFANFTYPSLFFLTAWCRERAPHMMAVAGAFLAVEMLLGLLLFSKESVLTPLMIFLLARMRREVTVKGLAWMAAIIVTCFVTVIPVVIDGRAEMANRHGTSWSARLDERLEVVTKTVRGELKAGIGTEETSAAGIAMVRISYVNQAAFAMSLYDRGQPGETLEHALAAFVPRFLWPEKPSMTQIGVDFNVLATGNPYSSSSPTLFGEAYWNFGWLGLLVVAAPMGLLLAAMSRYAIGVFRDGNWLLFPVVIMGMHIGHRVDGHVVADLIGKPVILVGLHLVLMVIGRIFFSARQTPQAVAPATPPRAAPPRPPRGSPGRPS